MKLIVACDRAIKKCLQLYRKKVFKSEIDCLHNDFSLVGKITLINRLKLRT